MPNCFENNFLGEAMSSLFGGPEETCTQKCDQRYAEIDVRRKICRNWCNAQCPKRENPPSDRYFDKYLSNENILSSEEFSWEQNETIINEIKGGSKSPPPTNKKNNINTMLWSAVIFVSIIVLGGGIIFLRKKL